jgi:hypothetical protein
MNTPTDQTDPNNYSQQYPRLVVKPGDSLVANYTENGHVTQDKLAPDNLPHPGQYKWYWTGIPFTGSTTDGSQISLFSDLDDKFLLSGPSNFDDGRCAESDNNSMGRTGPTNCQSHLTIPADTKPGIYALYWVWNFPKVPLSIDPTYSEVYTSCMDVEVVAGDGTSSSSASSPAAADDTAAETATLTQETAAAKTAAPHVQNGHFTTITRTRRHTRFDTIYKTITKEFTQTAADESFAYATAGANVEVEVVHREKWITIYQ